MKYIFGTNTFISIFLFEYVFKALFTRLYNIYYNGNTLYNVYILLTITIQCIQYNVPNIYILYYLFTGAFWEGKRNIGHITPFRGKGIVFLKYNTINCQNLNFWLTLLKMMVGFSLDFQYGCPCTYNLYLNISLKEHYNTKYIFVHLTVGIVRDMFW